MNRACTTHHNLTLPTSILKYPHFEPPKLQINEMTQKLRTQIKDLYQEGLFYHPDVEEYKKMIDEFANPWYWPTKKNQKMTPFTKAKRQIKNWFYQTVAGKKRGRPSLTIEQLKDNASNKNKKHRSNVYRAAKRLQNNPNNVQKPLIKKRRIDNIDDDDNKNEDVQVEFIFKPKALQKANMYKNYGCYNCKEKVHHYSGGFCSYKHCHHPICRQKPGNPLQFHNHCLVPLDRSKQRVCVYCAHHLSRIGYKFPSGNAFISNWANKFQMPLQLRWILPKYGSRNCI